MTMGPSSQLILVRGMIRASGADGIKAVATDSGSMLRSRSINEGVAHDEVTIMIGENAQPHVPPRDSMSSQSSSCC